jgi:hypothetical protein
MARFLFAMLVIGIAFVAGRMALDATQSGAGGRRSGEHFRPRARRKERRRDPPPFAARSVVRRAALSEMRDALTGGTLDADAELFRCADCQSFYSVQSVRALANDNGARCINCGSIHRIGVEVVD